MATEKSTVVSELTESFKASSGVYLADFTGLTVEKVTILRNSLRKKSVTMRVAKNTLIQRAFDNVGIKGMDEYLAGPTAVIMADNEDPIMPAKLILSFLKDHEKAIAIKGVHIEGQAYTGEQLVSLSKTPGKRELQSQVISLAMGVGSNLLGLIKGPSSKVLSQIDAQAEKLEKLEKGENA